MRIPAGEDSNRCVPIAGALVFLVQAELRQAQAAEQSRLVGMPEGESLALPFPQPKFSLHVVPPSPRLPKLPKQPSEQHSPFFLATL